MRVCAKPRAVISHDSCVGLPATQTGIFSQKSTQNPPQPFHTIPPVSPQLSVALFKGAREPVVEAVEAEFPSQFHRISTEVPQYLVFQPQHAANPIWRCPARVERECQMEWRRVTVGCNRRMHRIVHRIWHRIGTAFSHHIPATVPPPSVALAKHG